MKLEWLPRVVFRVWLYKATTRTMGNFKSELRDYCIIPRELVFSTGLSDRARFVYVFMSCKPDGYPFVLEQMAMEIGYGVDTLRKYLNELIAEGWLEKGDSGYTLKASKFSDSRKSGETGKESDDNKGDEKRKGGKTRTTIKYPADFEKAFEMTGRKGSKKNAYNRWLALTDVDKANAMLHIPFYYKSNERRYLKDFEGYLNGRYFDGVVYDKGGNVLYDPEIGKSQSYRPMCGGALSWNDYYGCYLYVGMFYEHLADGYTDATRPNGARVMLNNGRGFIVWNGETKSWENE